MLQHHPVECVWHLSANIGMGTWYPAWVTIWWTLHLIGVPISSSSYRSPDSTSYWGTPSDAAITWISVTYTNHEKSCKCVVLAQSSLSWLLRAFVNELEDVSSWDHFVTKKLKYILMIGCWMFYYCLSLQYQDTLK